MKPQLSYSYKNYKYFFITELSKEAHTTVFPNISNTESQHQNRFLTSKLNPSHPNPGQREKINLNFYFHTSLRYSNGFMKALKAFINPFEPPQRSVKIII